MSVISAGAHGRGECMRAFDTGPGVVIIDAVTRALRPDLPYDVDGRLSGSGTVIPGVVESLLADPYFSEPPPKRPVGSISPVATSPTSLPGAGQPRLPLSPPTWLPRRSPSRLARSLTHTPTSCRSRWMTCCCPAVGRAIPGWSMRWGARYRRAGCVRSTASTSMARPRRRWRSRCSLHYTSPAARAMCRARLGRGGHVYWGSSARVCGTPRKTPARRSVRPEQPVGDRHDEGHDESPDHERMPRLAASPRILAYAPLVGSRRGAISSVVVAG